MLKHREVRKSIRDRLEVIYSNAISVTSGSFESDFNIYNEAQLRSAGSGNFTPTHPYIYLVDSYIAPIPLRVDIMQPQVVVEIDVYKRRPFEIGNRSGRVIIANVQVIGKNRGERDDLGSMVVDYFGDNVPIKTYSSATDTGTVIENALIEKMNPSGDLFVLEDMFTPGRTALADAVEFSGQLLGWSRCSFGFVCKL